MRNSKICFNIFVVLYLTCRLNAVPAYPYKVIVQTVSGKDVNIYLRGDENQKYAVTADGYTLLGDTEGWWYATTENGDLHKSPFQLMAIADETAELKRFKQTCPKGLLPVVHQEQDEGNTARGRRDATPNTPVIGERRALVVLMQYQDVAFKFSNEDFDSLFNQIDYRKDGATGSVRDFYQFASQGQLDFITDIYGPYTALHNMSYYGGNASLGGNDAHAVDLCHEAMLSLPRDVDLSIYDNDHDGQLDNVHIIFAGYGEEAGASADAIWSHEYPHRISLQNEIGYSLAGYSCSPELRGNRGSNISNIGVVCHELGHTLGAMDYYDTNYGTGGEYAGTGQWDIMASGSWNDDGRLPPNFNPYVRSEVFGWNQQVMLLPEQEIAMPRMETDNARQSVVYRLETSSTGDYFLLENRQQYFFDAALPGAGLIIYHVHPNIERYNRTNTINATHPQCFYPVCASSSEPAKKKYGNINSAECPFPGYRNVGVFSTTSSPAAVAWDGSSAIVSLYNIREDKSSGLVSFTTSEGTIVEPEKPDTPTDLNLVYRESFETGISGSMEIASIRGKAVWRTYKKGDFVSNADLIPEANDGKSIFMLFSAKELAFSESEASGQSIAVEPGKSYVLKFDLYSENMASASTPLFVMYVEDRYGEYKVFTQEKTTEGWTTIELPLVFADSTFNYKMYGRIQAGGIFIDNIRLYKEEEQTAIQMVDHAIGMYSKSCRLDGTSVHRCAVGVMDRQRVIYIVRDADGTFRKIIAR